MNSYPCQHASYCPLRMRDGDQPGCMNRAEKFGCEPVVKLPVVSTSKSFPFIFFKKTLT